MIEPLKEFLKELKNSEEFKKFKENSPLAYNTSACFLDKTWQLDFYNPDSDKMTSFAKVDNEIISRESEVFRKEKKEIPELKLDKIKLTLEEAEKMISKKYPEIPTKKIIIIQQEENPFYNITYLTKSLDIINTKIDTVTGEILKQTVESALKFKKT